MADTQFGMWARDPDVFAQETENMELAIAHANRLQPSFAVI